MTKKMQQAYCDKFAVQFTHIDNQKEKQWIQDKFECGLGWRDLFSSRRFGKIWSDSRIYWWVAYNSPTRKFESNILLNLFATAIKITALVRACIFSSVVQVFVPRHPSNTLSFLQ